MPEDLEVYPACAGIDPRRPHGRRREPSLPRMRGDRPWLGKDTGDDGGFTPHARGSTCIVREYYVAPNVYPACAGIDRLFPTCGKLFGSLPRMRGDRPLSLLLTCPNTSFTPHARGSTLLDPWMGNHSIVYPACAGIDPIRRFIDSTLTSLPRMRGDRPRFCGMKLVYP